MFNQILYFLCAIGSILAGSSELDRPRLSIITSIYKGDDFIKDFMDDITHLKDFETFELLLINANSPGNEEEAIKPYLDKYPNIVYERLEHDPGIYGVWNYAIKKARADFVTNANLDDRRNRQMDTERLEYMLVHPEIDLTYSGYLITNVPNETFEHNTHRWIVTDTPCSPSAICLCLPGPGPIWRKSLHNRCGYFREDFKITGDHEFWCRAVSKGARFQNLPGYSLLFYQNPTSLSNNPEKNVIRQREFAFIIGAYKAMWDGFVEAKPQFLIKIPTRSRPERFFKMIDIYYSRLSGKIGYQFLITCDEDDQAMNNQAVIEKLNNYPFLTYTFRHNVSKVHAYNRDLDIIDFDIVLAGSDDMEPAIWGYDNIIAKSFAKEFPDYDGVLNFFDGYAGPACNTAPIIGKKYYDRFGFIFNPEYKSLYCQLELPLVSRILGKECVSSQALFKHHHAALGLAAWDDLYRKNESLKAEDEKVFEARRARHFDLDEKQIFKKDLSILICTLDERKEQFEALLAHLKEQVQTLNAQERVEILYFQDNRQAKVGFKRNQLIKRSTGRYVAFCDDDDAVHANYIQILLEKMDQNPDCISLVGIMTTRGANPQRFVHSIEFNGKYTFENNQFVRPPNHLNPIKHIIAGQFLFPESNFAEDKDWALQIAQSGLLKREAKIEVPYYFYQYDGKYGS